MSTLAYKCRQIVTGGRVMGRFSAGGFVENPVEIMGDCLEEVSCHGV
jgi:hypothetical protein